MHSLTPVDPRQKAISQGAKCSGCALNKGDGPIYGSIKAGAAKLLAVTERPSFTELKTERYLSGSGGVRLFRTLKEFGIEEHEVAIDSATLCMSRKYLAASTLKKATEACSGRLIAEILEYIDAKQSSLEKGEKALVLLLGQRALSAVSHHDSIEKWGGFPLHEEALKPALRNQNAIFFPTFAPVKIIREPYLLPVFRLDAARAIAHARGTLRPLPWPSITVYGPHVTATEEAHGLEFLEGVIRDAKESKEAYYLGFDIETAGKEPLQSRTICVAFATETHACSFYLRPGGGGFEQGIQRVLGEPAVSLVLQNGNHDWLGMETAGYEIGCQFVDILNAARIRLPGIAHDLQALIRYFLYIEKHKYMYRDDKGSDAFKRAEETEDKLLELMTYNAKDAWTQLQVWLKIKEMLDDRI